MLEPVNAETEQVNLAVHLRNNTCLVIALVSKLWNLSCGDHDPVQATHCMVVEPTLYTYMQDHCMYVYN